MNFPLNRTYRAGWTHVGLCPKFLGIFYSAICRELQRRYHYIYYCYYSSSPANATTTTTTTDRCRNRLSCCVPVQSWRTFPGTAECSCPQESRASANICQQFQEHLPPLSNYRQITNEQRLKGCIQLFAENPPQSITCHVGSHSVGYRPPNTGERALP